MNKYIYKVDVTLKFLYTTIRTKFMHKQFYIWQTNSSIITLTTEKLDGKQIMK